MNRTVYGLLFTAQCPWLCLWTQLILNNAHGNAEIDTTIEAAQRAFKTTDDEPLSSTVHLIAETRDSC